MKEKFAADRGICLTNDRSLTKPTAEQQKLLVISEEKGWKDAVEIAFPDAGFRE